LCSLIFKKEIKKASDKATADIYILAAPISSYGVNLQNCKTLDDCATVINAHSQKLASKKASDLKRKYGFSEVGKGGVVFSKNCVVYDIFFPTAKTISFTLDTNRNLDLIREMKSSWDINASAKTIPFSSIEYFTITGDIRYETEISGGGANLEGALVGGILFGGAGAVVGSSVGTEISSNTKQVDTRKLVIHCLHNNEDAIIARKADVDAVMLELRKIMPEKEYSAENGFTPKNNTVKTIHTVQTINTVQTSNDLEDLRKLKALLDDGIITQEEFDAKKKQLLGL
jgi:hypothetical protein